uniref:Zmp:0000001127 n=1 Tax=Pundamilia nyererei TaxID=303518 RepID=A0A3B4FWK3_9CICH
IYIHIYTYILLTCPLWQISQSVPLMGMQDSCVLYARTLLQNITDVLNQKTLFSGIDCTKQNMELYKKTSTPSACAPQVPTLNTRLLPFCFRIHCEMETRHNKHLITQPVGTLLFSLRELMKAAANIGTSFDQRLHLCKVLKGFQVRAITINRVIGYMTSDEYTK